jgi:hypothetical protein
MKEALKELTGVMATSFTLGFGFVTGAAVSYQILNSLGFIPF